MTLKTTRPRTAFFAGHRKLPSDTESIAAALKNELIMLIESGYRFFGAGGATGFDTVVISVCADVLSPKTVRASMGGIFRINVRISADMAETVRLLRSEGRRVFAAALGENSKCLGRFELRADDVFLVGNEGHGLSDELISSCTESVLIEMVGDTDSLNVSCASTILMWEMSKVFNGISVRSVTDHG